MLLPAAVLADGAPLGILGNGTGGLYIDINTAPYTTFAQKDWGQYAYNKGGCAWFASSSVNQLTGKGDTIWSGESWISGRGAELGFSTGTSIRAKALACYGHHVSVIEAVDGNNVLVSEGGYSDSDHGYCIIHWKTLQQVENGDNGSLGEFLGYVYLGVSGGGGGRSVRRCVVAVGESRRRLVSGGADGVKDGLRPAFDKGGRPVLYWEKHGAVRRALGDVCGGGKEFA
jgi:hypothetical protein